MDLSVHHTDSPSINLSLSAANPSIIPCNYGEKTTVNYLHKNQIKSPTISTLYVTPFGAPVHALSIQPIHSHAICLSLHPSMDHPCNLSIHHALHLSFHLSMHCPFHPSFPMTMNVRNSQMVSPVLSMGRKTHPKLQLNSLTT